LIEKFGKNDHAFYSEKEGCRNFVQSLVYHNLRHRGCVRVEYCWDLHRSTMKDFFGSLLLELDHEWA